MEWGAVYYLNTKLTLKQEENRLILKLDEQLQNVLKEKTKTVDPERLEYLRALEYGLTSSKAKIEEDLER